MRKSGLWRWALYVLAAVITLLNVSPLIWVALSSFKRRVEIFAMPPVWLPRTWAFDNYVMLLQVHGHELANTAVLTLASLLGSLALARAGPRCSLIRNSAAISRLSAGM